MISGVDLSHKNGTVDWDLLARRDVHFVFIQASEAIDSVDPLYARNMAEARERGIPVGAYHWLHPRLHIGQQAELFARVVGDFSGLLPPVVCLEKHRALTGDMEKNVLGFLRLLEELAGTRPIVYTSEEYWTQYLPAAVWGCDYPLWLDRPGDFLPPQVWPWARWTFWQQSYQENLPGVATSCGVNWFNGSHSELGALVLQS